VRAASNRSGVCSCRPIACSKSAANLAQHVRVTVGFQQVSEPKPGKNRLHLNLIVEDLDASTAEIEGLGGRWLEPGLTRELEDFRWRQMADPDGNEFDIDVLPAG
jgi:predicted enzyme related to lactoylglutathione lyase